MIRIRREQTSYNGVLAESKRWNAEKKKHCRWIWLNGNQNKTQPKKMRMKIERSKHFAMTKMSAPDNNWTGQMPLKIMMNPLSVCVCFFLFYFLCLRFFASLFRFFSCFFLFIRNLYTQRVCPIGIARLGRTFTVYAHFSNSTENYIFFRLFRRASSLSLCRVHSLSLSRALRLIHSVCVDSCLSFDCFNVHNLNS